MGKKNFTTIPNPPQPSDEQIEAYEKGGIGTDHKNNQEEATQRFSLDMPATLHRRLKMACATTGRKMGPEMLGLVEKRTKELELEARIDHK